jgi:hypothetical protein
MGLAQQVRIQLFCALTCEGDITMTQEPRRGTIKTNFVVILLLLAVAASAAGCGLVGANPTPQVIVVTATPLPATQTPYVLVVTGTPPPASPTPLATATAVPSSTLPPPPPTATGEPIVLVTPNLVEATATSVPVAPTNPPKPPPAQPTQPPAANTCLAGPDEARLYITNGYTGQTMRFTIGGGDWGTHDFDVPGDGQPHYISMPPGTYTYTASIPGQGQAHGEKTSYEGGQCYSLGFQPS